MFDRVSNTSLPLIVQKNSFFEKVLLSPVENMAVKTAALTYFKLIFHFYSSWKRQKTSGFPTFSGGTEIEHWLEFNSLSAQTLLNFL